MGYDYKTLVSDINALTAKYGFVEQFPIGKSVMGRGIHCLKTGNGKKKLLLAGAYHGLEYLTAAVLIRFIEKYAENCSDLTPFYGCDIKNLYNSLTLYAVPMVNPDGVDIAVNGLDLTNPYHRRLISIAGIHDFNRVWQANARGVDLNHNYDASWQRTLSSPAPSKYGGEYPESEPETKAMADLIRGTDFDMLVALHSQGGEIYCGFDGEAPENSLYIAEKMARASGYTVCRPTGTAAYGGCKDWFIREFKKPGFTIEIGHGQNPLPMSLLDEVFEDSAKIILSAMEGI